MNEPCYCNQCRKSDTFQLCPAKDIKSVTGKVIETAYRCRNCGNIVIYPVAKASGIRQTGLVSEINNRSVAQ